ncbi:hypothetical protein B7C42_00105 [Nocardia cerradoensis]|uniref:Uncharacterized protein n=1 Tax=Nocardia cerradoensis TaxID=85688 RepID=A0A231HDN5_9NOCA|nr:hypothetical protein [Nocardia cerradoensis]OXR46989.1 hypothetical protein B7C42_00105 [Nocardia cerradoensis]
MRTTPSSQTRLLLAQRIRRYHQNREVPRRTPKAPAPYTYSEELDMVRLAAIWLPFGGPPEEEIFTRFGISKVAFEARLEQVLTRSRSSAS